MSLNYNYNWKYLRRRKRPIFSGENTPLIWLSSSQLLASDQELEWNGYTLCVENCDVGKLSARVYTDKLDRDHIELFIDVREDISPREAYSKVCHVFNEVLETGADSGDGWITAVELKKRRKAKAAIQQLKDSESQEENMKKLNIKPLEGNRMPAGKFTVKLEVSNLGWNNEGVSHKKCDISWKAKHRGDHNALVEFSIAGSFNLSQMSWKSKIPVSTVERMYFRTEGFEDDIGGMVRKNLERTNENLPKLTVMEIQNFTSSPVPQSISVEK